MKKLIAMLVLICTMSVGTTPAMAQTTVDVSSDQQNVAYTGDGGLLLPESFTGDATQKYAVAQCADCVWTYTIYCAQDSTDMCAHAVVTCPIGEIRYRVGFGRTRNEVGTIGSVCWGNGKPATRRDVITEVHNQAKRFVPALRPGMNPSTSTLAVVSVIVWTRQPALFRPPRMKLVGHRVQVVAQGRWWWSWGDGHFEWRGQPGRGYPFKDITHTYDRPGTYAVTVTADWQADFTVAGIGTFPVTGPNLTQTASMNITVRSARSVLVGH